MPLIFLHFILGEGHATNFSLALLAPPAYFFTVYSEWNKFWRKVFELSVCSFLIWWSNLKFLDFFFYLSIYLLCRLDLPKKIFDNLFSIVRTLHTYVITIWGRICNSCKLYEVLLPAWSGQLWKESYMTFCIRQLDEDTLNSL